MTTATHPPDQAGVTLADVLAELRGIRDLLAGRQLPPQAEPQGKHKRPLFDAQYVYGLAGIASVTGMSLKSVERARSGGELPPAIRTGRKALKWRRAVVEDWIRSCTEKAKK